jgi:hypothetical protein
LAARIVRETGVILVSILNGYGPFELEQLVARTRGGRLLERALRGFEGAARARRRIRGLPWPPDEAPKPAYNAESGHVQRFHLRSFERLVGRHGTASA